jgi:glutamate dehydrogenase
MPKANIVSPGSDVTLLKAMMSAFCEVALPGENDGFDAKACEQAAVYMLAVADIRKANSPNIAIESFTNLAGRPALRMAMANDDMPFLVDSVAAALAGDGITIDHPPRARCAARCER